MKGIATCRVFGLSVRASIGVYVLLVRHVTDQWTELHRTLVDDVVEGTQTGQILKVERSRSSS